MKHNALLLAAPIRGFDEQNHVQPLKNMDRYLRSDVVMTREGLRG